MKNWQKFWYLLVIGLISGVIIGGIVGSQLFPRTIQTHASCWPSEVCTSDAGYIALGSYQSLELRRQSCQNAGEHLGDYAAEELNKIRQYWPESYVYVTGSRTGVINKRNDLYNACN